MYRQRHRNTTLELPFLGCKRRRARASESQELLCPQIALELPKMGKSTE